jgi:UDP-N-acetylmuramate dehydrogenase
MQFRLKKDVSLKNLTTFKVGGLAKYFAEVKNEDELIDAARFAKDRSLPVFVLGGGSNVLISDKGFDGLVIKYVRDGVEFESLDKHHVLVRVGAGLVWDRLVGLTVDKNLQGVECMSGIPGSVGAAPVQNIGAYGQEIKDVFVELTAYDLKKCEFVVFDKKRCKFAYRDSVFKKERNKGRFVITEVVLKLNKNSSPLIKYESLKSYLRERGIKNPAFKEVRSSILKLRRVRLEDPNEIGNAGSFFKNPFINKRLFTQLKNRFPGIPYHEVDSRYKLFAAWLIEKAGWKGKNYKDAKVSDKHALIITNPKGKALAKDIKELAKKIKEDVYKKFKVKLEPEVQLMGFDKA